jgi:indolepyruvate ferredoxin oxidoreductase beta subunit
MNQNVINVVFAGLGGQGVLKASDILAEVAFAAGLDVKKSEVHGMSQRGGSVSSDVRYGGKVASPMVPECEADYLVVLDETQVPVNEGRLKEGGCLIAPSMIDISRLQNPKSLNVALLGALSARLEFPRDWWIEVVKSSLPAKLHEMNIAAFDLGVESMK